MTRTSFMIWGIVDESNGSNQFNRIKKKNARGVAK